MSDDINIGFERETLNLRLDQISPAKRIDSTILKGRKFKQILASIKEVGIIEPLVVAGKTARSENYMLLDGHLRLEALKEIGQTHTTCLISKDDETYTYNKYISRKSPIQEHRMIQKMVKNGVSEEKIARTLNINVKSITQKRSLLEGICPEALDLLKDKMLATPAFHCLKKMKPARQIECAMIMIDMNDFSGRQARGMLMATAPAQLIERKKSRGYKKYNPIRHNSLEDEFAHLERKYKLIKKDIGQQNLILQFSKNYIMHLLGNPRIMRFLNQNHPCILEEFQKLSGMAALDGLISKN